MYRVTSILEADTGRWQSAVFVGLWRIRAILAYSCLHAISLLKGGLKIDQNCVWNSVRTPSAPAALL